MKAYLFFEWPYAGMGPNVEPKPNTEIDIPEGAYEFHGHFHVIGDCLPVKNSFSIALPRPKVKVKKWQWLLQNIHNNTYTVTAPRETETEIRVRFGDDIAWKIIRPISETELEVEVEK